MWVTYPIPSPWQPNDPGHTCGIRTYGPRNPSHLAMALTLEGAPRIGTLMRFHLSAAPASTPASLVIGASPVHFEMPWLEFTLLVAAPRALLWIQTDPSGRGILPIFIPHVQALVGQRLYLQAGAAGQTRPVAASNALELILGGKGQ